MATFRPLLDTAADQRLLVLEEESLAKIEFDARRGRNTLLLAPRGSGKTTFLNALLYRAQQKGEQAALVSGAAAKDARDLLQQITIRLGLPQPETMPNDAQSVILRLAEALGPPDKHNAHHLVLVDEFVGNTWMAYELFGRLREELWRLPLSWVVAANSGDREDYLRPPCDAFFSVVTTMNPLAPKEAQQLLRRRFPNQLDARTQKELATLSEGSPVRLVSLASRVVEDGESIENLKTELEQKGETFSRLLQKLDAADRRLVQELADSGPTGPWDERFLARLGWKRAWTARRLDRLVDQGFLTKSQQQHPGPGRPRTLYALCLASD
jgi:energy-coupling factor transporter ATP-binding protein EcfA2